jgi:hypothetical protein
MTTIKTDDFISLYCDGDSDSSSMISSICKILSVDDWNYLKDFRPCSDKGFTFTTDKKILDMMNKINFEYNNIHSRSSIGLIMRILHRIAKSKIK